MPNESKPMTQIGTMVWSKEMTEEQKQNWANDAVKAGFRCEYQSDHMIIMKEGK